MVRRTDSFTILAKPRASTVTEYSPGGRDNRIARPSALVVVVRETPLPGSAAVTEAPRTTAPLASFTTTCNSEVCSCAIAPANRHRTATSMHDNLCATVMESSSSVGELLDSSRRKYTETSGHTKRFSPGSAIEVGSHGPQLAWTTPRKLTPTGVRFLYQGTVGAQARNAKKGAS